MTPFILSRSHIQGIARRVLAWLGLDQVAMALFPGFLYRQEAVSQCSFPRHVNLVHVDGSHLEKGNRTYTPKEKSQPFFT